MFSSASEDFYPRLAGEVLRRYRANAGKSLWNVYQLDRDFTGVEPQMIAFISQHREQILATLENPSLEARLVDLFFNTTLAITYAHNQFVQVSAEDEVHLRRLYQAYVRRIKTVVATAEDPAALERALDATLAGHFSDLRANLAVYFDDEAAASPQANVIFQQVVCGEYDPEFQLDMLRIEPDDLLQPVLDLGCGQSGRLVAYLNSTGIRAYGIDRLAMPSELLNRGDWLELPLQTETWGTVISHMAFSNHFLFHHLYRRGHPERYARQYMSILAALKPGGAFYYTPGLPFIEKFLSRQVYRVSTARVHLPQGTAAQEGLALPRGGLHVSKIVKRKG